MRPSLKDIDRLAATVEPMLRAARIPGAALAVVAGDKTVYARGFGLRDLKSGKPVTPDTLYPIASTTKAMNATLLGMLVDEGRLEWDAPVQRYLPRFRLRDAVISPRVTVRDLVTMRTGLPRHDWVWIGNSMRRAQLVECLAHLEPSSDFRQRFQYNNLSVTVAGHIAEIVTGKRWETLIEQRLFRPLGMLKTSCARPAQGNVTLSYHENHRRKLVLSRRLASETIACAGGAVYSTVTDMAQWVAFNLNAGRVKRRRSISAKALAQIHAPQVIVGDHPLTRMSPEGAYALGWLIDYYNGHKRISHGGYLHDVYSSVMFFADVRLGMVSFVNFGCSRLADLINQHAFDVLMGSRPMQSCEQWLAQYEVEVAKTRKRNASIKRTKNTRPSHSLDAYVGKYAHPAYGEIRIQRRSQNLFLLRRGLRLPLQHWHHDTWAPEDNDLWPIHQPHAFDRASRIQFHTAYDGQVEALSIPLEPEVAPIRFAKQ